MAVEIRSDRDRSLNQILDDLRSDAGLLVRQEIALAKAELKEKGKQVAKQGVMFVAGGVLGYTGLLILLAALILGVIAIGVAAWLAALIVGVVVLLAAFLIIRAARHVSSGESDL